MEALKGLQIQIISSGVGYKTIWLSLSVRKVWLNLLEMCVRNCQ